MESLRCAERADRGRRSADIEGGQQLRTNDPGVIDTNDPGVIDTNDPGVIDTNDPGVIDTNDPGEP
jgi:hypothetical protein